MEADNFPVIGFELVKSCLVVWRLVWKSRTFPIGNYCIHVIFYEQILSTDIVYARREVAATTEVNKIDFQETLKSSDTLLDLQG